MHTTTLRMAGAAGGALLLAGIVAAPALAEDYPPSNPASDTETNNSGGTDSNPSSGTDTSTSAGTVASSGDDTPAYTGAATTVGLAAAVVALGAGAGLLVASRRRNES